jgi:hypothetical protein
MTWYAAHLIMAVKLKEQTQLRFPIWENIVLIQAKTEREGFAKAGAHGRQDSGDNDGSFRWDGQPATWVFAGVRKLVQCALMAEQPGDGDEVSYAELELDSYEAVEKLAAGDVVDVRYQDRFRPTRKLAPTERPKRENRKRA